ncbi:MAG: HAMP domain-containing histidine kinase [Planctomycetes bacterium]|nr:HAMP domain-containing histidine kinase [Planctomycetota bacterium]
MASSKKTLTFALLLQLVPVTIVAWIGLRELGRLEEQVRESLAKGKLAVLAGVEESLRVRLEELTIERTKDVEDRAIADVIATIGTKGDSDLPGRVLFAADGEPVFPRRPPLSTAAPSLSPINPNRPGVSELTRTLREADVLGALGRHEDAAEHVLAWEPPRNLSVEAQLRLAFEKGRLLRRIEQKGDAIRELRDAERLADTLPRLQRARAGTAALVLVTRYLSLATRLEGAPDSALEGLDGDVLDLLRSIARGDYDAESDAWLDRMAARVAALHRNANATDGVAFDAVLAWRAWHVEQRSLTLALLDRDLGPLETTNQRFVTITLGSAGRPGIVVFSKLGDDSVLGPLWLGHAIDLDEIIEPIASDIEARLAQDEGGYQLAIVDANGREIYGDPTNRDRRAASEGPDRAMRLAFGGTLHGLTAELRPEDPLSLARVARRTILLKSVLLVALAVIASIGAFLLIRTVRRESELAALRTEFVGRVSHELKTPLALIRMYGETLALGRVDDPEKTIDFARIIAKESTRLTEMIDRVLDFSRIEAKTKSYTPRRSRVDLLVADVIENYRSHLASQGFEIHFDQVDPIEIDVDEEGLTEALINLLSNAAKYHEPTDEKRIDVTLDTVRDKGDAHVRIRVRDHGIGVPPSERQRIFDTFYRAQAAGERRGAGLGLALVKHFVEAHGGSCRCVDNEDGNPRGSTFELLLPLIDSQPGTTRRNGAIA